jgi:hypothetical protein
MEIQMNEVSIVDLRGQVPAEICIACARRGMLYGPTSTTLVHCHHGEPAGCYRIFAGPWTIVRNIDVVAFREMVARGLTLGELKVDLERDLLHLLAEMGKDATKH